jgi:hypothetical protein
LHRIIPPNARKNGGQGLRFYEKVTDKCVFQPTLLIKANDYSKKLAFDHSAAVPAGRAKVSYDYSLKKLLSPPRRKKR